jgi:hypothetical protein
MASPAAPELSPTPETGARTPFPSSSRSPDYTRRLGYYDDPAGRRRELVARTGAAGSVLVIDRGALGSSEQLLLAHLAPDEPPENASIVCQDYLARETSRRRCRALVPEDSASVPLPAAPEHVGHGGCDPGDRVVFGPVAFRLAHLPARMVIPELRWTRSSEASSQAPRTVSLREAIGEAESYEPFCTITRLAIARYSGDATVSCITLRTELERVCSSSIVLNRGIREAVVRTVRAGGSSMSEIAIRCGRIKRDGRGNESGETSWLARRVGLLAEGGQGGTTPWVHSDVLGLIARRGLGISPREVELG